ncbi:MAG TPA: nucleoside hydrolase [Acidimicrobiia bacterium]|nr:nucleoside hydrolase [Acidimicrobiia bacterium]
MAAGERGEQHRGPSTRAFWVVAVLLVFASSGCDAASSKSASPSSSPSTTTPAPSATGPRVIIDTDLSLWWDDATAIGIANVLQQQGAANVLGIMADVKNPVAVAAIDAINPAYGHDDIPLGAVANSKADTFRHGYTDVVTQRLPHSVGGSDDVPEAVALYRELLGQQPDRSVTIVSLGAYTNLAGLLAAPDGPALVSAKVKRLVIMDGIFPTGMGPVTNQKLDLAAARAVIAGGPDAAPWPTPIAWVDGVPGIGTRVGETLCEKTATDHPMRIVYEALFKCGKVTDGNWDAPALLFALGDIPEVFSVEGRGGAAAINAQGGLSWQPTSSRRDDFYVHLRDQKRLNERIDQLLNTPA